MQVETLTRTLHLLNAAVCLPRDTSLFINFDPSVFTARPIADGALRDMRLVLHEAGIDPRRVVCEVTEQRSASQEALFSFVASLKSNGFRIAVDDYGAEDSDMSRIKDLQPRHRQVRRDVDYPADGIGGGLRLLLTAMVANFAEQGIQTVFEGIEESWQLDLAEKSGASMVQGYALAKPEIYPAIYVANGQNVAADPEEGAGSVTHKSTVRHIGGPRPARSFGRRLSL